ncbi:LysR family transcriptional regulator [Sphingomonas sp.]
MQLPDFEAWALFARVVEHRSFSEAALASGVSKATVSKAIRRLEERLGTSLFHRTSRSITLTQAGQSLHERARRILAEAEAAEEAARDGAEALAGRIRVAAPLTFGVRHVGPAVADFLAGHPDVEIDLALSDARIDIVAEGIDIALRIADLPDSSLRARRLATIRRHLVAAPAYLQRHGRPRHPAELGEHRCFAYTNLANPDLWRFSGPDGEEAAVRLSGPLRTDNGDAMVPALLAGLGIAWLPEFIVDRDLADGRLETILPEWTARPVSLHLLTPPGTLRPARVEALIDHFASAFRAVCASGR